jgi:hypothetical protein
MRVGRAWWAAALLLATLAGCRDEGVLLTFRPEVGTTYRYEVVVRSSATRRVEGGRPEVEREEARFDARHTVVDADDGGIRVEIELRRAGSASRTYVVRYDRAAQLEAVESIEGISVATLGGLGLAEIFPAAAGAPPDRALAPGDRWIIDETVQLPGEQEPSRLRGDGRLDELGVVDGLDVARIVTRSVVPIRSVAGDGDDGDAGGRLSRQGSLTTRSRTEHDLSDGSVRRVDSTTTGLLRVTIAPPEDVGGEPVEATVAVEVESETRRR